LVSDDSCFYSSLLADQLPKQSSSTWVYAALSTEKLNQTVFIGTPVRCQKLQQVFEVQSFSLDTGPQSFCYSFIALLIICCSKLAQKFAVRVRQVATVVTETTHLVLSQF